MNFLPSYFSLSLFLLLTASDFFLETSFAQSIDIEHIQPVGSPIPLEDPSQPSRQEDSAQQFDISIRTILAANGGSEFDSRIDDLKEKLSKLPYSSFKLVSDDKQEIGLLEKSSVRLQNGQKLCMRAVDRTADSVTLWIKWTDIDGDVVLDTRMSFAMNETLVAGVEGQAQQDSSKPDQGIVLAVKVSPANLDGN